jgi:glucose/arabinose dehydrogenase
VDWEDGSAGPCPGGGRCLYVADIGDNQAKRPGIVIYRVPEPAAGDAQTRPAEALQAEYPDGAHDAEAMFVLPDGGVYVVTKGETGHVAIYRLPRTARPGTPATLELVAELRAGRAPRRERITGATASPDGRWIVLRTLDALSFYRAGDLAAGRLGQPFTHDLKPLDEKQGEAVEFGPDGTLYLSSEGGKKEDAATLSRLACTLPG